MSSSGQEEAKSLGSMCCNPYREAQCMLMGGALSGYLCVVCGKSISAFLRTPLSAVRERQRCVSQEHSLCDSFKPLSKSSMVDAFLVISSSIACVWKGIKH